MAYVIGRLRDRITVPIGIDKAEIRRQGGFERRFSVKINIIRHRRARQARDMAHALFAQDFLHATNGHAFVVQQSIEPRECAALIHATAIAVVGIEKAQTGPAVARQVAGACGSARKSSVCSPRNQVICPSSPEAISARAYCEAGVRM